jgi:hypothetical protein
MADKTRLTVEQLLGAATDRLAVSPEALPIAVRSS